MGEIIKSDNLLPAEKAPQELWQYLTFMLGGEVFAIGILHIKEIIEYAHLTEVPHMPAFVHGVINLRGAAVPVIDLNVRFGKRISSTSSRTCVVIIEVECEGEQKVLGLMVDSVNEVLDIAPEQIEPAPSFGTNIRADFIGGMGKVAGKFVIILNVNHVLSLDEVSSLAGVGRV